MDMKTRRRLLSAGGKPLIVYKEGDTALTNGGTGEYVGSKNFSFTNGCIELKSANNLTALLLITGIDFSKYKKLYIEAKYGYHGYSDSNSSNLSAAIAYNTYTATRSIKSLDISDVLSAKYIWCRASGGTSGTASLYNIWLE